MDAVTDTVANEIYSQDNCSPCVFVCVRVFVCFRPIQKRHRSSCTIWSTACQRRRCRHRKTNCRNTSSNCRLRYIHTHTHSDEVTENKHTHHTLIYCISSSFITFPLWRSLHTLIWDDLQRVIRLIHDKHTRQKTLAWPPRCAPFLKTEGLSWDIQTCCGRLNLALHFLGKGYVLTGRLELSKTVSRSSVTEDFSFGRANSAKPTSAEITLTWNNIFHHLTQDAVD